MENASKALIIAGAILIAILLISVGIIIMNSSGNTERTVESTATSMEIQSFNAQLTSYLGTSLSGKQVRNFLDTVIVINSQGTGIKKSDKTILINYYPYNTKKANPGHAYKISDLSKIKSQISDKSTYQIFITSGCGTYTKGFTDSGYIGCISIKTLTK